MGGTTNDTIKAMSRLAPALILAALLNGGIYQIVVAGAGSGAQADRKTLARQATRHFKLTASIVLPAA
jgi:hypothetical protein